MNHDEHEARGHAEPRGLGGTLPATPYAVERPGPHQPTGPNQAPWASTPPPQQEAPRSRTFAADAYAEAFLLGGARPGSTDQGLPAPGARHAPPPAHHHRPPAPPSNPTPVPAPPTEHHRPPAPHPDPNGFTAPPPQGQRYAGAPPEDVPPPGPHQPGQQGPPQQAQVGPYQIPAPSYATPPGQNPPPPPR